jgi:RNA polymerase sigma factor (sigma-70 family)
MDEHWRSHAGYREPFLLKCVKFSRKESVMRSAPAPHVAGPSDDVELVRRALTRDDTAFRTIMERHNRRLYRIARGILRNDSEAEDVVQEAYVKAFTHLGAFRGDSSLATWLSRITMNEALGRLRRERPAIDLEIFKAQQTEAQIIKFPHTVTSADPERTMAQREILQLVERATDKLPEIFRRVHDARDRGDEHRGNRGPPWSSAADGKNAAASGAAARARGTFLGTFFAPLTVLTLHDLPSRQLRRAAEEANLWQTAAGAFGITLQGVILYRRTPFHQLDLADFFGGRRFASLDLLQQFSTKLENSGLSAVMVTSRLGALINQQATLLALNDAFLLASFVFLGLAAFVWLARPTHVEYATRAEELRERRAEELI